MNPNRQHPRPRAARIETESHSFKVGQVVRLKRWNGMSIDAADTYQITATLPPRDNSPQYRIRSESERHERVAAQDSLELTKTSKGNSTLIERTFSGGQRTKT
ncbi:hypothetical protein [Aquamicrobium sp. LC103]|uniref:hypothetical protein n=1 Tax=Aquamicrobium sp. LC103 TaxID=1120658 RepID=UPI00063ECD06|nr:hypothetical protein [Aquamicrobium sp. LC103]TKT69104.1 hypothetical protein XW59_029055 [Aquamicrobium sp. LC103]